MDQSLMDHVSRFSHPVGRILQGSVPGEACGSGEWQRKEVAAECLQACTDAFQYVKCQEGLRLTGCM